MHRRHFFRRVLGLTLIPAGASLLSACSKYEPMKLEEGQAECPVCKMKITARPFAAQIRDKAGAYHFFDDFGCAVHWIRAEQLPEHELTFWVIDHKGGYWIDARRAVYVEGPESPHGFNLAASAIPQTGELDYEAAKAAALAKPAPVPAQ